MQFSCTGGVQSGSGVARTCLRQRTGWNCGLWNVAALLFTGHSIQNTEISKPLTHTAPYMLSAQRSQTWDLSPEQNTGCRWSRSACPLSHLLWLNQRLQQLWDHLGGEGAGCGGPVLPWLRVVCCRAGGMYLPNSRKGLWRRLMWRNEHSTQPELHLCNNHAV